MKDADKYDMKPEAGLSEEVGKQPRGEGVDMSRAHGRGT